jgi:tetratricopeptide (TPR) repeat protein
MPSPFLSSEEYDERAHQLYNDGRYDEAIGILREGVGLYPNSVELHVGIGYAQLAREEYAWARRAFDQALVLEPDHEDALAGVGEVLLKIGADDRGVTCFRRILELGYNDDVDLMLQVGRTLFREGSTRDRADLFELSRDFFETAARQTPGSVEALACIGYTQHRLGDDEGAIESLRRALQTDGSHSEARIYLANLLYDRNEAEAALYHFERTSPEDHWDELGLWRVIELKRAIYRLEEGDPELQPWEERIGELASTLDSIDEMLMEVDAVGGADSAPAAEAARGQLELFGSLLTSLADVRNDPTHEVELSENNFGGSWEDIVRCMRDTLGNPSDSLQEFMNGVATHGFRKTGVRIPTHDAEAFLRGSAKAGLLRILR